MRLSSFFAGLILSGIVLLAALSNFLCAPLGTASFHIAPLAETARPVLVSERDGVPNLVRVPLGAGVESEVRLTNVTGAALAPEPAHDGTVYYLRLHSRGLDLSRVKRDTAPTAAHVPPLPPSPAVVRDPVRADTFSRSTLPPSSPLPGAWPRPSIWHAT